MKPLTWALLLSLVTQAANYSARRTTVDGIEVVELADRTHDATVSIVPSIGNLAYSMKVHGKDALWFPYRTLAELKAKPVLCGVPFLAPWANRIDQDAYYANGKKYLLNGDLGNIRRDPNKLPIHGLLMFSPHWKVTKLEADKHSARVTSRLEYSRHPDLMAQFPFAHTIEMTYRLSDGVLEVETVIENQSDEPLPVAVGYHPYFQIPDAARDQWNVHVAAREQLELTPLLVPSGERKPVTLPDPVSLATTKLDDVFTGLIRGKDERAEFWVESAGKRVSVTYGPKYTVAIVYAPPGQKFICFEPMAAVTNAFNLAHAGIYKELQSVAPGTRWHESFWISTKGF